jgi:hypothetical protein
MARFDITQYSTVAERIDAFWKTYPAGRLHTELVHFSPEQVVIRAEVYLDRKDERPVTVDYAEERIDSSPVNRVSMVENCATLVPSVELSQTWAGRSRVLSGLALRKCRRLHVTKVHRKPVTG